MSWPTSYLICTVQRSGSWFLCHALEDTGVLGLPSEYFHPGDEPPRRAQWAAETEQEFLEALTSKPVTSNGVWASKMMWNQLDDALLRFRRWPQLGLSPDASDRSVLEAALPSLRYVWLRRADALRQGISWWRADVTDQYAKHHGEPTVSIPATDLDTIGRMVQLAKKCDSNWRDWFARNQIEPLELEYDEMVTNPLGAVRAVAALVGVELPRGYEVRPRLARQADETTEVIVEQLLAL